MENDKYKEKLLLTNVKNVKNGQHYSKVNAEIKEKCKVRDEQYVFNVAQTRQKFKRCITMCRNAVMKVKTSSGIRRFQEDKELGNWFAKLLPVISSMKNCQPQQAIEPGSNSPEINEANKESNIDEVNGNKASPDSASSSSSTSSTKAKTGKRKFFVPTPANGKKSKGQTESLLCEIKETVTTLKTLASDTSSKDILDFLKEESQRQAARDDAFLKIMGALVQQPSHVAPPVGPPMPSNYNQFRYDMSNYRLNSSMTSNQPNFSGAQEDMSFTQQLNNPNYPKVYRCLFFEHLIYDI